MQRTQLVSDEIYHVVLRAVGDTAIFNDENDFFRGIFSLYEFNNRNPVDIWLRRKQREDEKIAEKVLEGRTFQTQIPERELFVDILSFCFMPNHIHLLLKQKEENGISNFMQKLGTGYATYFNKKYNRKGHLFNRFKAIHIKTDEQLQTVFVYIHTNPLSLIEPGWKERGIENPDKAIKFLEEDYRWSSFFDFLGKKNFPSVTDRDFLYKIMNGGEGCREAVINWIRYKKELKDFDDIVIE